jgi:hypothetical protein
LKKAYIVVPFFTGCMGGSLDEKKLTATLNEYGAQGWKFARSIHETKRVFGGLLSRETHFLVFERDQ